MLNRVLRNQNGGEQAYAMGGIVFIIVALFLIVSFATPYLKYSSISTYSQELVNYDYMNDRPNPNGVRTIQNKLMNKIKVKKIPIDTTTIKVDYDLEKYYVKFEYQHPVNLFVTKINLDFKVDKESNKKR